MKIKSTIDCHSGGIYLNMKHSSLNTMAANLKVRSLYCSVQTLIGLQTPCNYLNSFLLNDSKGDVDRLISRLKQSYKFICSGVFPFVTKYFLTVILLLLGCTANAQEKDAKALILKVIEKFNKVQSYQADAVIDTKIFFLNILPQKAHISFKQPDDFKVTSTGIALLPKQNFDNIYSVLRKKDSYDAFITGNEKLISGNTTIVNVIPNTDTTDLILAKLWVDEQENIIRKAQLTTRTNGTILIEYEHKKYIQYALPDKVTFTVDVKKFKIPKAIAADINSPVKTPSNNQNEKKGKIIITIKNYKIN